MYVKQPLHTFIPHITNAVANTNSVQVIIGPPGAGKSLRIAYLIWTQEWSVLAGTGISARFQDTTALNLWGAGGMGAGSVLLTFAEPGFSLGSNLGLQINSIATVASQPVTIHVSYFIDGV